MNVKVIANDKDACQFNVFFVQVNSFLGWVCLDLTLSFEFSPKMLYFVE